MKTNLKQQLELTNALVAEPSKPTRVRMLREWLKDNGYETIAECKHYSVNRMTGNCTNCSTHVMQPIVFDSEESLEALRSRLRGS